MVVVRDSLRHCCRGGDIRVLGMGLQKQRCSFINGKGVMERADLDLNCCSTRDTGA